MRRVPVMLAGIVAISFSARGQVTTNDSALDSLRPPTTAGSTADPTAAPTTAPVRRRPPARPAVRPQAQHKPPARGPADKPDQAPGTAQTMVPAPTKKPVVPVTPPAILALPPAIAVPMAHPPAIPDIAAVDDAPGQPTPIQGGLRVTFGANRADFSPASLAAITAFAHDQTSQNPPDQLHTSINIFAYATGTPDDPSTPRRLALERALNTRAVLLKAGLPSPRIYPRALGPAGGDTDPDRVDIVAGTPTAPPVPSAPAKAPAG